ncbi:MAG: C45 family autoproteolytic acyltransferase/hydrolase [Candidatus Bipolaricaulis sp.]|nr:C45 family autoproteolytic acyltransferase/hydrolase [Candidatus Bipolaricaulis sp.]
MDTPGRPGVLAFRHDVIEGPPYEAGDWQGRAMAGAEWRGAFSAGPPDMKHYTPEEGRTALRVVERHCPGIAEEIRGASDATGIPIEKMTFLGACHVVDGKRTPTLWSNEGVSPDRATSGGCSHFHLPRKLSPEGHVRLGVNYDCHPMMQELRLCTTRIEGKASHVSFSDTVFGRVSGLNEYGLGLTSSRGSPLSRVQVAGLPYCIVSRILLDRCRSVSEALGVLDELPIAWYSNYILADRSGEAALVEIACSKRAVRRFASGGAPALFATNHFVLPEMNAYSELRMQQSVRRREFLRKRLEQAEEPIARPHDLLGAPYPDGLCMSYYDDGLGTLDSLVLDLDALTADVSFGPPSLNSWHAFDLNTPAGSTLYTATIETKPAPPGFWKRGGARGR